MSSPRVYAMIPVELIGQFQHKYDVENYIKEKKAELRRMEDEILHYFLMTDPKKWTDDEYDPFYVIQNKFKEMFPSEDEESVWEPGYGLTYWQLTVAQSILEHWDETHHKSGMAYAVPRLEERKGYCVGDGIQECNEKGEPVDYQGNLITKESDSYDQLAALNWVDKLADGTTKEDWKQQEEIRKQQTEKEWKEMQEKLKQEK